jgi:hypothetical protein
MNDTDRGQNGKFRGQVESTDKLVTELTSRALRILSTKALNEQVSYDVPFAKSFHNDTAIFEAEQLMLISNDQGFQDMFGRPFSNVVDFLYALELDEAGLQPDEDSLEDLWDFIGECTRCRLCET